METHILGVRAGAPAASVFFEIHLRLTEQQSLVSGLTGVELRPGEVAEEEFVETSFHCVFSISCVSSNLTSSIHPRHLINPCK